MAMIFGGANRDMKFAGNLLIRESIRDKRQHLQLLLAELVSRERVLAAERS